MKIIPFRFGKFIPFSYKMMIPYLLLVMMTDIIVGYFSYRTTLESRTELVKANVDWTLQQIRDNIRYQMTDLQALSDSLFSSTAFQDNLQAKGDASDVYDTTVHKLIPLMETPLKMSAHNQRLIIYVTNPSINEIYGNLSTAIKEKGYYLLSFSRLATELWYDELKQSGADNVWREVGTDQEQGNLSLLRKIISFRDYQTEIGYMRISVPMKELFLFFSSSRFSEGAITRVMYKTGNRVLYPPAGDIAAAEDSSYLHIKEEIPGTDFYLETMVPLHVLLKDAGRIRSITLLVCGVSFILMALIGILVARYSGRKMIRIVSYIRLFQRGNFTRRIPYEGSDEFAQISGSFNQMADHIDVLIREVYLQSIKKKEAELEALQAQINPHFLYNTLSSIKSLAKIGETEMLCEMVTGLAKFYRLTLNDGNLMIPLDNEISQVKAYLDIQSIKYANRFTVSYDIAPGLSHCRTIKIILQPFVENVFKHAWYEACIHIRIVSERAGDKILLKVIDDGIGMNRETLDRLFVRQDGKGGYGIRNVNERIKLQFGDDCGVVVYSRPGIGTTVLIRLPYEAPAISEGGIGSVLSNIARGR